jgi:hypothetical protein
VCWFPYQIALLTAKIEKFWDWIFSGAIVGFNHNAFLVLLDREYIYIYIYIYIWSSQRWILVYTHPARLRIEHMLFLETELKKVCRKWMFFVISTEVSLDLFFLFMEMDWWINRGSSGWPLVFRKPNQEKPLFLSPVVDDSLCILI